MVAWRTLHQTEEVDQAVNNSATQPQLIFKHSSRCATSSIAKDRIERAFDQLAAKAAMLFVDVLQDRPVSNYIQDRLKIQHESPQLILIKNGEVVLDQSHTQIQAREALEVLG